MTDWRFPSDTPPLARPAAPVADAPGDPAEEGSDLGAVRIHHAVIAEIARRAALAVPGVVGMSSSFAEGLASMVGRASFEHGVRIVMDGARINVDLHLVIAFGARIPQLAWRLQNDVRKAIEDMTGKKIAQVNVIIQGVRSPGPAAPAAPADTPIGQGDPP